MTEYIKFSFNHRFSPDYSPLFRHRKEKRPTDQDERLHRSNHIISEIAELEDVNEGPFFLNAASRIVCQPHCMFSHRVKSAY